MNYRILKNGQKVEDPKFQNLLASLRKSKPEATEEDLLNMLNAKKSEPKTPAPHKPKK